MFEKLTAFTTPKPKPFYTYTAHGFDAFFKQGKAYLKIPPPPPSSLSLAALTMASTLSLVISPSKRLTFSRRVFSMEGLLGGLSIK